MIAIHAAIHTGKFPVYDRKNDRRANLSVYHHPVSRAAHQIMKYRFLTVPDTRFLP